MVLEDTFSSQTTPLSTAVNMLAESLHGRLIRPGDEDYDRTRRVWNMNADRYPRYIVRAAHVADVLSAVRLARRYDLAVVVRGGGHGMTAFGATNGNLMIDLSGMKNLTLNAEQGTARLDAGLTWGEVAEVLQPQGLAIPSGDTATVGVAGLTLGGGIGWLVRRHGLAIDSLISANIVTADGRLLTASADQNPDLFWAIRGGGGNFGIATSFLFKTHNVGMVLGGVVMYDGTDTSSVLEAYAHATAEASEDVTTIAFVMAAPPAPFVPPPVIGKTVILMAVCYSGDLAAGESAVAPFRTLATPIVDIVGPMPYAAMFELTREAGAKGQGHSIRSMFVNGLDETIRNEIASTIEDIDAAGKMVQIRHLGGAAARISNEATAFAHRDKPYMISMIGSAPPEQTPAVHSWVERSWAIVRRHAAGVYMNFLADEGEGRRREAYSPQNYQRLVALKNRYDPTNLFHLNQNIKPTV